MTRDRRRVLFVISSLERGGSEGQLAELLVRVHPEPLDATLATIRQAHDARHENRLAERGIRRVTLAHEMYARVLRAITAARRLDRLLRELRPDVVYAWGEHASLLAVPLGRLHGIPVMVARRNAGNVGLRRRPLLRGAVRLTEPRAALVTAVSADAAEEAERAGVPRERLRLVPNGHCAPPAAAVPTEREEVRLGYVANLRVGKGHRRLLRALAEVRTGTPWRVDVAGAGPLLDDLRAEVADLHLDARVRFLGVLDDMAGFWRTHEVAVLLSDSEGSPNALIEAALAGRPLVATDVPGSREVVSPEAGVLVSADDPAAIARTLERVIDDRALRDRLGRGARASAERFDMARMVAGHLGAIAEIAGPL